MKIQDMITVLAAAEMGKKIEMRVKGAELWVGAGGGWNFAMLDYRVKPSPIAAGHNPEGLTEEVVGVGEGWRLLTVGEMTDDKDEWIVNGKWKNNVTPSLSNYTVVDKTIYSIRTKRPLTKEVPLTMADFAEGGWLFRERGGHIGLVVAVGEKELSIGFYGTFSYATIMNGERRNLLAPNSPWEPCKKTITVSGAAS